MFSLTSSMQYYLYSYPTDMRWSFYTLGGMVANLMGRNVQGGDVYILAAGARADKGTKKTDSATSQVRF